MGATVARVALEGARRSRDAEAGGVTRDSNAHLTASSRFVDRWSREKSRPGTRVHQGSYVQDAPPLVDARGWSRRTSERSARRANGHVGAESGTRNTRNATASSNASGMKRTKRGSERRHASTCSGGTRPIRSGSWRRARPGTTATESGCSSTTGAIGSPISMRSERKSVSGPALGTPPIRRPGRNTSEIGAAENPDKSHAYVRAATHKRRIAAGGQGFSTAEWLALLAHHGGSCAYRGGKILIEIDHRIPLSRGGSNLIDNILPACRRCNRRKHRMTEDEFRELLQRERRQGLELGLDGLDGNAGTTRS